MIDTLYQAQIDKNLDAQQFGPKGPATGPSTWQNFGAGAGGFVAGPMQFAAGWSDILKGSGETLAATGAYSKGGMFATPDAEEQKQNDAAATKIALQGPDTHSEVGTDLRTKAKDYMPDPQATGKAGQILFGLSDFASQAIPAGMAGPTGLLALGSARGVQKSAELEEQGVDQGTRTVAGLFSGTLDAASMLAPMTGPTRLIAASKGAAGGVGISVAQTEAEKLILQHGGYDKLASTYDPFDPVSLTLSGIVPAAFGGLHAPTTAKAAGGARAEPTHADVTLTPEEAAHSQVVEDSTIDTDIASLKQELARNTDAGSQQILKDELTRLTNRKAALADPATQDAARVTQTAAALDHSRLTPDDDIAGHEQHQRAVETASDQIARGEPVEVSDIVPERHALENTKVVDVDGLPLTVYHGTTANFLEFDLQKADGQQNGTMFARGIYLTEVPEYASMMVRDKEGANVRPANVNLEHPLVFDSYAEAHKLSASDWRQVETSGQHDGVIIKDGGRMSEVIAFRPEQVHSAFDRRPLDLRRAVNEFGEAKAGAEEARSVKLLKAPEAGEEPAARPPAAAEKAPTPEGAAEHPGPEAAQLEATTAEVLRANPDLMVQLDGMEPMRAADLLEAVRQQASDESRDSSLLQVAAQCAISL